MVTVEENSIHGGFGSAVLELLHRESCLRETLIIGMPDQYIDHASPKQQREQCGLDPAGIARQIFKRMTLPEATQTPHPAPTSSAERPSSSYLQ